MIQYFQKFFKTKPNLFQIKNWNKELEQNGYFTFPILNQDEVEKLIAFYQSNTTESLNGFHATMFHNSVDYRTKCNKKIVSFLENSLSSKLNDSYFLLYGNFMVKESGIESEMKIHQDWSYVDEKKHDSFAIWIPLVDLNEKNGAIHVLPKSHKIKNFIRGPGLDCPFINQWPEHKKNLIPQYLKAGEAIVWNHRVAHYSPPNNSPKTRLAITAIITPKSTPILHYFQKPEEPTLVTQYKVNPSFFLSYNIQDGPKKYINKRKFNYQFKSEIQL